MKKIFLGLGSDLGDRMHYLSEAARMTGELIGTIVSISSVYETEPWGFKGGNNFLNMVIEVESTHNPFGLLGRILMIESELGRLRNKPGYASRTIDIDILFFGDEIIMEESLMIPHKHLSGRKFILVPLNEIAPELIHPVLKKTIRELLQACQDTGAVSLYQGYCPVSGFKTPRPPQKGV